MNDHVDDHGNPIHPPPLDAEGVLFDLVADLPEDLPDPTGSVAQARSYCLRMSSKSVPPTSQETTR